jgi:TM2 domain-containing membrane protein YozV
MPLNTQEQILIEQRVANEAKSAGVAYLLLIFLGGLGAHRFYLGYPGTAAAMLVMFLLGWVTLVVFVGGILLLIVAVWWIIDLFLIPGMVSAQKESVRNRMTNEILVRG